MSKAEYAVLIALCAALASAIGDVIRQRSAQEITDKAAATMAAGAGHDVVLHDEAVSNRQLRRAAQGFS
jgi:hypothetical protein